MVSGNTSQGVGVVIRGIDFGIVTIRSGCLERGTRSILFVKGDSNVSAFSGQRRECDRTHEDTA